MKAGGIELVATYVPWLCHEEEEGVFDFEGQNDLRAFVTLIGELGMEAAVRIGPWVHGELRNGRFPGLAFAKAFSSSEWKSGVYAGSGKLVPDRGKTAGWPLL